MNRKRQRDRGNGKNKAGNRAPTRHDLLCSLILAKAYMILAPRAGIEKAPPAILRFIIESLLKSTVSLDPRNADAFLQLGILYANQHKYNDAITQYEQALKLNSDNAAIHYRFGQALIRTGAAERARQEFAEFERLHTREVEETAKQTADIQQFVYTLRHSTLAGKE